MMSPSASQRTSMSSGGTLPVPGAKGSIRLTIGSARDESLPRFTTFQVRFLSQLPPPWRSAATSGSSGGLVSTSSSRHGSKNFGPPCAVASHVTQPPRRSGGLEGSDGSLPECSGHAMGILTMPSLLISCGPDCSTIVPQRSTATSSLSKEQASRATMSPLLEPLWKITFQRGRRTCSRYFGPPNWTAEASTVTHPRGNTGMRCKPSAGPLTNTSTGPACCT
mmetsp:Transcript_80874/g.203418  ORF Transcript_80874/g.203418 Transcript_80874/m.203418 type:complete len:222 (-) Transcript_80874:544-1209(-)